MAARRELRDVMEEFKSTVIWKEMCKYLDGYIENRTRVLQGLTGDLGLDFDLKYSKHDLMRSDIRFIELVLKKLPDVIIEEENNRILAEEGMKESQIQEQVDALGEMVQ